MSRPADLLADLRAADEHLAALAPGAHVEARLRARLRGEAPSSRGPFGGFGLRLRRPLILAMAVAAGALYLVEARAPNADHAEAAPSAPSAPSAPPEVIPDRIAAHDDPPDPTLGRRRARTPPVIHAPALEEQVAPRRDGDPPPLHPVIAPPSAPTGTPRLERPRIDSNSNGPVTPVERRSRRQRGRDAHGRSSPSSLPRRHGRE